jgi:hypothetical protein
MFSKKVEEFDDVKQCLAYKEKDTHSLALEKADLVDFKAKYLRECAQKEDLYQKYSQLNELLEGQAIDNQERVETILREK